MKPSCLGRQAEWAEWLELDGEAGCMFAPQPGLPTNSSVIRMEQAGGWDWEHPCTLRSGPAAHQPLAANILARKSRRSSTVIGRGRA